MKKPLVISVLLAVILSSFYLGWRVGRETNWQRDIQTTSSIKIGPYEKTDWRRVSTLTGGYEVWVDAGGAALAVTEKRSAIAVVMDRYTKEVLDGAKFVEAELGKSHGLFISYDRKRGDVEARQYSASHTTQQLGH